ncbi:MAG: DUF5667 domain-containing protein [Candidatus Nomurabacteria bacterium]|nr:DUF5667 domain-containing protein [Candidatus Nomurabacteria bacterium]
MNTPENNFIKIMQSIRMTVDEKTTIRDRLEQLALNPGQVSSPYSIPSRFSGLLRTVGYSFAAIVLVVGTGFGIVTASADSLPGDSLYAIKLGVENVQSAFKRTSAEKGEFEATRVTKRLGEASQLAIQNKLDDGRQEILSVQIAKHTESATREVSKLAVLEPERAQKLSSKIQSSVTSKNEVLKIVQDRTNSIDETSSFATAINASIVELAILSGDTIDDVPGKILVSVISEASETNENIITMEIIDNIRSEIEELQAKIKNTSYSLPASRFFFVEIDSRATLIQENIAEADLALLGKDLETAYKLYKDAEQSLAEVFDLLSLEDDAKDLIKQELSDTEQTLKEVSDELDSFDDEFPLLDTTTTVSGISTTTVSLDITDISA